MTETSSSKERTLGGRVLSWAAPKRRRRRTLGRVLRTAAPVLPNKPAPSRPIFVLGAPRSGTTVLFDVLNQAPGVASLDRETGVVWDTFHRVEDADRASHEVGPEDVTSAERRYLDLGDRPARAPEALPRQVAAEHPPGPYLQSLFPDASFVFLRRDGRAVVSFADDRWRSCPRFGRGTAAPIPLARSRATAEHVGAPAHPGWEGYAQGHRLAEVCAFQWVSANESSSRRRSTSRPNGG